MKKRRNFVTALLLSLVCALIYASPAAWAASPAVYVDPPCEYRNGAFYGIWIGAAKNYEDAVKEANHAPENLGTVQIFLTTDWSNLNTEPWYVLTAGMYASHADAKGMLPKVQASYPDAYIKYSGTRTGSFSGNAGNTTAETAAPQPFYGIWCQATKSSDEAEKYAKRLRNNGFQAASVFLTSDWNNLNKEPWYVVTAGVYQTEKEAKNSLSRVRSYYSDAYVKYSGTYVGKSYINSSQKAAPAGEKASGTKRISLVISSMDQIIEKNDQIVLQGKTFEPDKSMQLVADNKTVFDASAEMQFFGNYEDGDTVVEWYKKNLELYRKDPDGYSAKGMALLGVFDIDCTGDHIDRFYGSYWWD